MKGLVFTEFLEMVSEVYSPEAVEKIIDASALPNKGAYTGVGTYDYQEMVRLVRSLSRITGVSSDDLQIIYGKYLFKKLKIKYAKFVLETASTFEFLQQVDNHVHVEVRKLYPEAELPRFDCEVISPTCMKLKYQSNRPFAKLAEGLMLGCAENFNEKIHIESEILAPTGDKKNNVLFTLTKED